jgi:NADH:ubiquinone oxidoreductase subunit K
MSFAIISLILVIILSLFFLLFAEYNLLLSVIYLELSFVTLALFFCQIAAIHEDFYPVALSVVLLVVAAGDSVISISFLIYLNRMGTNSGLSYLRSFSN